MTDSTATVGGNIGCAPYHGVEWKPMKDAPMDGTWILVQGGIGMVTPARYNPEKGGWEDLEQIHLDYLDYHSWPLDRWTTLSGLPKLES